MNREQLTILLRQLMSNGLSPEEQASLKDFIERHENRELFVEVADELNRDHAEVIPYNEENWKTIISQVMQIDRPIKLGTSSGASSKPVHRIHFLKTAWFRYAAAVMIIIGIGAYLYTTQKNKPVPNEMAIVKDVPAPASSHATITLADGSQIVLDSAANGALANQENVLLKKLQDGQVVYSGTASRIMFNTLTNPRGSKTVVMTLSDGSKVWLNSESSITYPTAFIGNERTVQISGEAYFEVAHDANKTFKVKKGTMEVSVLGTHFNVNAYNDEPEIKITLLEGSVKVMKLDDSRVIKPGEQARVGEGINVTKNADLDEVMAWKKGKFQFKDASIETIMKQVARWYNAEVVYEGTVKGSFVAGISREVPVSKLLQILELTNRVKFEVKGNKIIVRQ